MSERAFVPRPKVSDEGHRVTTFELLFDLVFVFAFTQVTGFMTDAHSAVGVLQAMIILNMLWLSWSSYAWLANRIHVDEGAVRLGMCGAMIAIFVVALVIPEAFQDLPGGLSGPLVLVGAYFVVRVIHSGLFVVAAGDDVALRKQVLRTGAGVVVSVSLLIAGVNVGGVAQTWFWLAAVVADGVVIYATSSGGSFRVHSAAHWAERHGLVMILALGESIVAIGVGAANEAVSAPILLGVLLAITLTISLWWTYFGRVARAAERLLAQSQGIRRAELGGDAYTMLHFLMIAGIVISALGVEEAIARAAEAEPLGIFGAAALFGGTSLYVAGHAFFWRRVSGRWNTWQFGAATLLLALGATALVLPALVCLALVAVVVIANAALQSKTVN
ncbi:MAG: low temperature requirement protein A [Rhodoglobus sp.]